MKAICLSDVCFITGYTERSRSDLPERSDVLYQFLLQIQGNRNLQITFVFEDKNRMMRRGMQIKDQYRARNFLRHACIRLHLCKLLVAQPFPTRSACRILICRFLTQSQEGTGRESSQRPRLFHCLSKVGTMCQTDKRIGLYHARKKCRKNMR